MIARKREFLSKHIVGIDFDPILVRASKMNMVMNNDGTGQLFHANSLEPFSGFEPKLQRRCAWTPPTLRQIRRCSRGTALRRL